MNTAAMRANLDAALRSLDDFLFTPQYSVQPIDYAVIDVATLPESDPRGGYGTPTVLGAMQT